MKKLVLILLTMCFGVICTACSGGKASKSGTPLPEIIKGQTFIYDELETGEGTVLYTLIFTEDGYKLYNDDGVGIIAEGLVDAAGDKTLTFHNGKEEILGKYTGSAFETPSVTMKYDGRELTFVPATESTEYVYLSYLGVFEGQVKEKPAILILERWFEFYLYTDGTLLSGTYEIYQDGKISFSLPDGKAFSGTIQKDSAGQFSVRDCTFILDIKSGKINEKSAQFAYAKANATYDAEHAMGVYTLSLYNADVFAIHGVDGLVKAIGTVAMDNGVGKTSYFQRAITGNKEADSKFNLEFTYDEDIVLFPDSTYLLPRSGNIDEETGKGVYWSAGTKLEFIKNAEDTVIEYDPKDFAANTGEGLQSNIPEASGLLRQSMPSVGTAKPLVLLIDFPDYHRPRFVTPEGIENALFDINNQDSLSAYYYRSSYGNLTIDGTVLDWYRTERNRDEYDSDKEVMTEAVNYYINSKGLKLSDYDADNNGVVDSLYVLWAGNMDEESGIWKGAYRSTWRNSPEAWEREVSGYIVVPGSTVWSSVPPLVCNVNSLTHESGHLLGLNDYYSYDTTDRNDDTAAYSGGALEGGIGGMDMMDANIGDHNAFSKWLLGWIKPKVVEYEDISSLSYSENVYTLKPSNEQGDALFIKLKSSDSLYTEMLVVEVVSPEMNAKELTRLKEPVVRILHVEASLGEANLDGNWRSYGFKYDNSYTSTKFISILEADAEDTVLNYMPASSGSKISYDVNDYFAAGAEITADTYPNTNAYDEYGNATVSTGLCIKVESISDNGEAVIRLGYKEPADTLKLENTSPQAAVVPYEQGKLRKVPAGTKEFIFTFDRAITESKSNALARIKVLSGNEKISGYSAAIKGSSIVISFDNKLEGNNDYTVIIPQGIIAATDDKKVINNFNGIYGFVTE